jgi:ubiquinone/menaquinone biosynthesis C-methylase UbiE
VIGDNVSDHVYDPDAVLNEVIRVLKPGGFLYLIVNLRTRFGTYVHKILSRLLIDKGHPQSFDAYSIRKRIARFQFSILSESVSDSREARLRDMRSNLIKDKIKCYTGLSEYLYYALCQKF